MTAGSYRMQEHSREEMAARDPYEGRGVFLAAPGLTTREMLDRLAGCAGADVAAVAWGGIGVWFDPGSSGMSAAAVRDNWDGGRASECG